MQRIILILLTVTTFYPPRLARATDLTDAQRIDFYNKCEAQKGFQILSFVDFVGGLFTGDIQPLAQTYIDGYQNGKGCDVFLTAQQIAERDKPSGPPTVSAPGGNQRLNAH